MNTSILKSIVSKSKLNKVQIADRCGFTRVTLENVLQGADVKVSTIEALARVLEVSTASFFLEDSNSINPNSKEDPSSITPDRLLSIIESQQRTIENLSLK